jgi:hypothetical protein
MKGCSSARDIPDVRGYPAARPDDACHFRNCLTGIGKVRNDQSHDRNIETVVAKGQCVRITGPKSGRCCSGPRSSKSELAFRRIDPDNFNRSTASDKSLGESAVTATYIEPPTIGRNVEPVQEDFACDATPPTH